MVARSHEVARAHNPWATDRRPPGRPRSWRRLIPEEQCPPARSDPHTGVAPNAGVNGGQPRASQRTAATGQPCSQQATSGHRRIMPGAVTDIRCAGPARPVGSASCAGVRSGSVHLGTRRTNDAGVSQIGRWNGPPATFTVVAEVPSVACSPAHLTKPPGWWKQVRGRYRAPPGMHIARNSQCRATAEARVSLGGEAESPLLKTAHNACGRRTEAAADHRSSAPRRLAGVAPVQVTQLVRKALSGNVVGRRTARTGHASLARFSANTQPAPD